MEVSKEMGEEVEVDEEVEEEVGLMKSWKNRLSWREDENKVLAEEKVDVEVNVEEEVREEVAVG